MKRPGKIQKSKFSNRILFIAGAIIVIIFLLDQYYQNSPSFYSLINSKIGSGEELKDRNCTSFKTQAEAQKFFEAAGGPTKDPYNLDKDGDATVCESLPYL